MIIDIHGHVGTSPAFYIPEPSEEWLVRTNRRLGIVACGISHLFAIYGDTTRGNHEAVAAARRWGGDLGVWLVANPKRPRDLSSLEELLSLPDVWGFKFHSDVHETALSAPSYDPFLQLAVTHDLPILAHGQADTPWSNLEQFDIVANRYPTLKLIVGHSGLWPYGFDRAAEIAAEHENLFLDTSGSQMTGRALVRLVRKAGATKVLFGSDAIFLDQRYSVGMVKHALLTTDERNAIFYENASQLLKLQNKES